MSPFTKNIPNILTISRIILAPIFFILFVYDYIHLALLCFLTASVTDALDGFIARKFNVVSKSLGLTRTYEIDFEGIINFILNQYSNAFSKKIKTWSKKFMRTIECEK